MQASGLLSTCLTQMEMKWWTKGSSWWYGNHHYLSDLITWIWCLIYGMFYPSWKKFSVRRRTEKTLLKICKDRTSKYELKFFFSGSNVFFHQPGFTRKGLKSMLHAVCTSNTVTKFATYHIGTIGGLDLFFYALIRKAMRLAVGLI